MTSLTFGQTTWAGIFWHFHQPVEVFYFLDNFFILLQIIEKKTTEKSGVALSRIKVCEKRKYQVCSENHWICFKISDKNNACATCVLHVWGKVILLFL